MPKKRSIHSYQDSIGAREAFTYARRSLEDTTKPEEPIGSLSRAIGSNRQSYWERKQSYRELSGVELI